MIIKKCDRCGAVIDGVSEEDWENINYTVRYCGGKDIDLCLSCLYDLEK